MSPFFGDIIFFWVYIITNMQIEVVMKNTTEKIRELIYDELPQIERASIIEKIKHSKELKLEYSIIRALYENAIKK